MAVADAGDSEVYRAAAIAPRASYAPGSGIVAVVSAPRVSRRNRILETAGDAMIYRPGADDDRLEPTEQYVAAMNAAAGKIRLSGTGG
jgi:hypothetical protein